MPEDPPLPVITLRPFEPRDCPRLLAAIKSLQDLVQWAGLFFRYPLDLEQLEAYRASALGPRSSRRIYTACDADGCPIGHIELNEIDGYSARVCRVLVDPPHRARGYGQAMVRQILRLAFNELGLKRLDLGVFDFNTAAIRCYQREGFVREGHLREARRVGNETWSLDWMAILEREWHLLEAARSQRSPGDAP